MLNSKEKHLFALQHSMETFVRFVKLACMAAFFDRSILAKLSSQKERM